MKGLGGLYLTRMENRKEYKISMGAFLETTEHAGSNGKVSNMHSAGNDLNLG
jgi:hypothetical protein